MDCNVAKGKTSVQFNINDCPAFWSSFRRLSSRNPEKPLDAGLKCAGMTVAERTLYSVAVYWGGVGSAVFHHQLPWLDGYIKGHRAGRILVERLDDLDLSDSLATFV
jgi:hypothetical protein